MTTICEREELVLDLLRNGRELAGSELEPHVAACASCADLLSVATALLDEHHDATHDAPVPTSGVVWWRMQRRARQEAMRTAARTVTAVQVLSVAAAIVIAVAIVGVKTLLGFFTMPHLDLTALAQWSVPLAIALMACVALAPVAVYLSVARD